MDLTSDIFTHIFSPLAAFLPPPTGTTTPLATDPDTSPDSPSNGPDPSSPSGNTATTQRSPNLQNNGKAEPEDGDEQDPYRWHLNAIDGTARRYFAAPRFALGKPPLRVDVYIPPLEGFDAEMRARVRPERGFYALHAGLGGGARGFSAAAAADGGGSDTAAQGVGSGSGAGLWSEEGGRGKTAQGKTDDDRAENGADTGKTRVQDLEVGRWLGGVLSRWQRALDLAEGVGDDGVGALERRWWSLPFGSAIVVDVSPGWGREEVCLVPEYGVEQGMVGAEALARMWAAEGEVPRERWDGVRVVEWERLRFGRQLHEVISLVAVDGLDGVAGGAEVVFKSVLRDQRYMYNELKMLLSLPPHPNVVPRPLAVVTKKGRFGNRRGVCGFLLEWLPAGSLRERLLRDDMQTASTAQRLRWARQVTEALVHVNGLAGAGFYPDLKPDNVVLREDADSGMLDAVLIDFEQRGGWYAWSPPEVAYLEYLEFLVDELGLPDGHARDKLIQELRQFYGDQDWSPGMPGRGRYCNAKGGFSTPWLALLKKRHAGGADRDSLERAQVFALGKLLWCIFEGQPRVRCGIDHEVLRDPDPERESEMSGRARAFPEFKQTPPALRQLIRTCTAGAPEWDSHAALPGVVLREGKLYAAASESDPETATPKGALDAARAYWTRQVECARAFVRASVLREGITPRKNPLSEQSQHPDLAPALALLHQAGTRPLFSDVLEVLGRMEAQVSSTDAVVTCPVGSVRLRPQVGRVAHYLTPET